MAYIHKLSTTKKLQHYLDTIYTGVFDHSYTQFYSFDKSNNYRGTLNNNKLKRWPRELKNTKL